jgi:hypothetical protein
MWQPSGYRFVTGYIGGELKLSVKLQDKIIKLINARDTIKVLSTVDNKGIPHTVFKDFLEVDNDGNIIYLELIESSATNNNMVNSIWFKKKVSITIRSKDNESYQIKGIPVKAHISGQIFKRYYEFVKGNIEDGDLSTVWVIKPEELRNETYTYRKRQEEEKHPLLIHLDRLAK